MNIAAALGGWALLAALILAAGHAVQRLARLPRSPAAAGDPVACGGPPHPPHPPDITGDGGRLGSDLVLASVAGLLCLYLAMTALALLGIPWRPATVASLSALVAAGAFAAGRSRRRRPAGPFPLRDEAATGRRHRPSLADLAALASWAVFTGYAVRLCATLPDFYFHWGVKAEHFVVARGIDYPFLSAPWNWPLNPGYPLLLPDLYAATALLGGRFSEPAMMLWSAAFFALLLLAARAALVGALGAARLADVAESAGSAGTAAESSTGRWIADATLALTALVVAAAALRGNMAGGADWVIALALVAALPALLHPPDRAGCWQLGLTAALAAAAKNEGAVLAAAIILVQFNRLGQAAVSRRRSGLPAALDLRSVAALVVLPAVVFVPWQMQVLRHHLAADYLGALKPENTIAVLQALRYELFSCPTWHGFTWALFLLPLIAAVRRLRPVAAVVTLQLLFYFYVYWSFRFDAGGLVITSFERFQLHLLPAILVAAGIALAVATGYPLSPVAAGKPRGASS